MRRFATYALGVGFVGAGAAHFTSPDFYLPMMPTYLPWHLELIYLSGLLEIVGGLAVLVPGWRSLAGYGLIALLIAIFPANLHMAMNGISAPGMDATPALLWGRLPVQGIFIAWAWWATRPTPTH